MLRLMPCFLTKQANPISNGNRPQSLADVIAIAQLRDQELYRSSDVCRYPWEGQPNAYEIHSGRIRAFGIYYGLATSPSNVDEQGNRLPGKTRHAKQPAKWLGAKWKTFTDGYLYNKAVDIIHEGTYLYLWHLSRQRRVAIFYSVEGEYHLQVDLTNIQPWDSPFTDLVAPNPKEEPRLAAALNQLEQADREQAQAQAKTTRNRYILITAGLLLLLIAGFQYKKHREQTPPDPVEPVDIVALFAFDTTGVAVKRDGSLILPGDKIAEKGTVETFDRREITCSNGSLVTNYLLIANRHRTDSQFENAKIYNIGIKTLEPLFEHWGYTCDFQTNHQITLLKQIASPADFVAELELTGVIYVHNKTLYTAGTPEGYIITSQGSILRGTKSELARMYQPHVPYQIQGVDPSPVQFTMPILQPREAIAFMQSPTAQAQNFTPEPIEEAPEFCSVYGDKLYIVDQGSAHEVNLKTNETYVYPVEEARSVICQDDLVLICTKNPAFVSVLFKNRQRIAQTNGGALDVSYAAGKAFADWNIWSGEIRDRVLTEITLSEEKLVETGKTLFSMPTIYQRYSFNRKGWWVVDNKGLQVIGTLEPILYGLENDTLEIHPIEGYIRPPGNWFDTGRPLQTAQWLREYIAWVNSYSLISGAWRVNSRIYVAHSLGVGPVTVTDGSRSVTLEAGERCAGLWFGKVIAVSKQGPTWRQVPFTN